MTKPSPELNKRCFDAVSAGEVKTVEETINEGADVNAHDPSCGYSPLAMAAHMGHADVIRCLVRHGGPVDGEDQLEAVNFGYADALQALIDAGADPNWAQPETGETPLHVATFRAFHVGSTQCVRILLEAGADPNVHTKNRVGSATFDGTYVVGETPLHNAAAFGDREMVRLLIDAGADLMAQDADGHTPRHYFARHQRSGRHVELECDAFVEILSCLPVDETTMK